LFSKDFDPPFGLRLGFKDLLIYSMYILMNRTRKAVKEVELVTIDRSEEIDSSPYVYYEIDKWYTINLNPLDSYQYLLSKDRLKTFQNNVHALLLSVFGSMCYQYNIEISEPHDVIVNQYPRLHVHGRFMFLNNEQILNFLLNDFRKLGEWGRMDIKKIDDIDKWDSYCSKFVHVMGIPTYKNYIEDKSSKHKVKIASVDAFSMLKRS